MGHGKETPRQKMIGLMYLFLTAMLALNVSKSVLDSFILVSDGLEKTIDNFKSKNDKIYNEFDKSYMMNQAKVGPWKEKADIVRKESESLFALLEKHKHVHVKVCDANHDPYGQLFLREALRPLYENEPRVTIDDTPGSYYCFEWGAVSLFYHHGHKKNLKQVSEVFVGTFYTVVLGKHVLS